MSQTLRIAIIGLDTSHAPAFANLLHDETNEHYIPGAKITAAFPGGSPDFPTSFNRVEGFTNELRDKHGVKIVDSIECLRPEADAIFLLSVDGRVHLEQFRKIAEWGLPVFIDKPFAAASADAREIKRLAAANGVRTTTASALRYADVFRQALSDGAQEGNVTGADFYGPLALLEHLPGYFWYGVHTAEMLFAALGTGCREVDARRVGDQDIAIGTWADGRFGVIRGNRTGNNGFGGVIHRESKSRPFDVSTGTRPYYAPLLEDVLSFIKGGPGGVSVDESVEVIRFLEAANESVASGKPVAL